MNVDDETIALCRKNDTSSYEAKKENAASWRKLFGEGLRLAKCVAKRKLFDCDVSVYDDIAQETMIAVSRKILSPQDGIEDGSACERMIRTIARNKSVDFLRRQRVKFDEYFEDKDYPEEESSDEVFSGPQDLRPGDASIIVSRTLETESLIISVLRSSLRRLGNPCKTILRRFYLDSAKHKEIAEEIGVQVNQMGMRISRCLKHLHPIFTAEGVKREDVL